MGRAHCTPSVAHQWLAHSSSGEEGRRRHNRCTPVGWFLATSPLVVRLLRLVPVRTRIHTKGDCGWFPICVFREFAQVFSAARHDSHVGETRVNLTLCETWASHTLLP
ncbi:hypothetical protein NDU88_009037 [Pleurodeles waltl]|uniref:Uncharacterized protein n=1 Tax=Pleurodeles waltl TaxID=8319 RepID=A0AAV7RZB5_PLEWA|nr:hypothetical protein NDU88_009037 [Pleurodeles waltl]